MPRQIRLNLSVPALGAIDDYARVAQQAQAAQFDSISVAGIPALGADPSDRQIGALEPLSLMAALAVATERIGLIATASTTFKEPYDLARALASIDHISKGRAGWNIATTETSAAVANFGLDQTLADKERYARADEFLQVATKLWDSWDDDAEVGDKAAGLHSHAEKVREIGHEGERFKVSGPMNVARSPQAYPVLARAVVSDEDRQLASRWAELIFTEQQTLHSSQEFTADIKRRAGAAGRLAEELIVLPTVVPFLGSTEAEASARAAASPDAGAAAWRFVGTPDQLVDEFEQWLGQGAADGFNVQLPAISDDLEIFSARVIPRLEERGLLGIHDADATLRERYGLRRPANQFDRAAA